MAKVKAEENAVNETALVKSSKVKRTPVGGARDILTVSNKDPNFEYRWVKDIPGRIQRFQEGGYELVTDVDLESVGQRVVDRGSTLGSVVTKTSGIFTLVLMRIPKEWYDEDQLAKQVKVDALEESMRAEIRAGYIPGSSGEPGYGKLDISRRRQLDSQMALSKSLIVKLKEI